VLSVMVTAAVSKPALVGVKCPWIVQLAPATSPDPQSLAKTNDEESAPVTLTLVMASATLPLLVNITDCDALVVPTSRSPNDRLVADSVPGGFTPDPLSEIDFGEPVALSAMTTAAVSAPPAAGVKCPWMVQLAPPVRLVPQLFANTNEEASGPVTSILVKYSVAFPVFVRATSRDVLVAPTVSLPNDKLVADNDAVVGP